MRLCERNLKTVYHAEYEDKTPILDGYGNETGRYQVSFGNVNSIKANVSAARGTADVEQFGTNLDYSKVLIVGDVNCPISETSVLWVDSVPIINAEGKSDTPHDYVVVAVAKSLNYSAYAIRKVKVS